MKLGSKLIVSAGLFFAGAALYGYFERNKEDKVLVRGRIDKLFYDGEHLSEIEVIGVKYDDTDREKALIRLGDSTRIIKKFTKDIITSKDLSKDDIVEVIVEHDTGKDETVVRPAKIVLMT